MATPHRVAALWPRPLWACPAALSPGDSWSTTATRLCPRSLHSQLPSPRQAPPTTEPLGDPQQEGKLPWPSQGAPRGTPEHPQSQPPLTPCPRAAVQWGLSTPVWASCCRLLRTARPSMGPMWCPRSSFPLAPGLPACFPQGQPPQQRGSGWLGCPSSIPAPRPHCGPNCTHRLASRRKRRSTGVPGLGWAWGHQKWGPWGP